MSKIYTKNISDTANNLLNETTLDKELRNSSILNPIFDGINREQASLTFDLILLVDRTAAIDAEIDLIVSQHDGSPLQTEAQPVTILETPPFAKPDYRTKRDANSAWTTCPANVNTVIDFVLSEERYVTGGEIIFKNVKEGDYISAEVYDKDNVIPEAYRAALCEAHPTVSKYVIKKWIIPTETDKYGSFLIDTYPLNAKITQGLYLRVTYHASAETGDRKCAINYHLTKSLL